MHPRVFIAFRLQPRSALCKGRAAIFADCGLHCLSASTTFRTLTQYDVSQTTGLSLHCLSASTTFRTSENEEIGLIVTTRLHCLSASTTFRTNFWPRRFRQSAVRSSLPFGFNHVPHLPGGPWRFRPVRRLHCLSASTTFRTSTVFNGSYWMRGVFIAFRLQPRSARKARAPVALAGR